MGHAALSLLLTMAASVQAAESTNSSIAPANYRFEASGAGEAVGRPRYVFGASSSSGRTQR